MIVIIRLLFLLPLLLATAAVAQQAPVPSASAQLAQAERDIRAADRALDGRVDDDARRSLRAQVVAAQQATIAAAAQLTAQLALVDARVAALGAKAPNEAPEIVQQRAQLSREHSAIDAAIRRGGLAKVEADQLVAELDRGEAEQFAQAVSTKVPSPLAPAFWRALLGAMPRDLRRIELFLMQGTTQIEEQRRGGLPWQAVLGAGLALVLLFPARVLLRRLGQRYLIEGAPGHRVRRSGFAVWRIATGTLSPLLAAAALVQGLRWAGLLPERWSDLLDALVGASAFAGFAAATTGALLMRTQPSWRMAPIDDATAARLRPLSWLLAALAFGAILINGFNTAVGASSAADVATQAVLALLHLMLIAAFLLALARIRGERAAEGAAGDLSTRAGLGLVELIAWIAVVVAVVSLLLGYIGLSYAIVQFVAWATLLGSATYILAGALDDVLTTVFRRDGRFGQMLTRGVGLRGSSVDQIGLLLSGVGRGVLLVVALGLLVSPFGAGGGLVTLFGRLGALAQGVQVGGVAVSPGTILRGLAVLFIGLALVRGFMGWLENKYLPVTDLDGSGRNSVSLVARYLGIALAVIWSLASLGVGVERIALLLSALSVGIGFGLQAITSNFVSGLILLAERPIKIGDLIRVGLDEGDVKRISVRSTEIELADHSTLIVPNSELITKSVLNKTLANPMGRIQVQFSVPITADAGTVRQILLDAYAAEEEVLADPAPVAFVDSIVDGRILFNSFAHVSGPRAVYPARSSVLMMLLTRLRDHGIEIGTVPQKLELIDARPAAPAEERPATT
ncbi:DUF3772 domain-containing protein [Sphingomonas rubra]|uniref:Small-conductance mechanosensitive channel n=1 Tax=Sphingomonas rubra TaxID=634430 RepID=A0A1I5RBA0_9SPHN|nr:DUF3772 domain-containing protein [Sphingomonas rubra]SFP55617.1 Small-conductance mechanosensitive channel [Sphingomonas rubra]